MVPTEPMYVPLTRIRIRYTHKLPNVSNNHFHMGNNRQIMRNGATTRLTFLSCGETLWSESFFICSFRGEGKQRQCFVKANLQRTYGMYVAYCLLCRLCRLSYIYKYTSRPLYGAGSGVCVYFVHVYTVF